MARQRKRRVRSSEPKPAHEPEVASGRPPGAETSLVLADIPERVQLREIENALERHRDEIAELDLEIETLRGRLLDFERTYHARLAQEYSRLKRIDGLLHHLERWRELLAAGDRPQIEVRGERLEQRRAKQLGGTKRARGANTSPAPTPIPEPGPEPSSSRVAELKQAYRALARRYHPDLARTEEEQRTFGQMMARINELYRAGDLERIRALAEQAKGASVDDPESDVAEKLEQLSKRLHWFQAVARNLVEERAALERSPTCELMRNVEQAEALGRDLVEDIRRDLELRVDHTLEDIRDAARRLEFEVKRYNRRPPEDEPKQELVRSHRSSGNLTKSFDPFADKQLVRLGLAELSASRPPPRALAEAEWLESQATTHPALARLVLLAHVSELSPFPLAGLESYDDLARRFAHLAAQDETPMSLEQALVEADHLVEYGVRKANASVAHAGLHYRSETLPQAVTVALRRLPVRREFKRVLGVLDEFVTCGECHAEVYAVPLYRTRGLDNLRASVCPACHATLRSYWMPKGTDVQAVLNEAFIDFELVWEWSLSLGGTSVAIQMLPEQAERLTLKDLKKRLIGDLFHRYEIEIEASQVVLVQEGRKPSERTPLADLESRSFEVVLEAEEALTAADVVETLRHRVRQRFRTD